MAGENLVFAVNGEKFEVLSIDPSTTLLEYLRTNTRIKSAKLSCGEGGCGACIVILSKYDPLLDQVEEYSINSCLTLLCSINGCSITTSEGLGNTEKGFHPIHKRFAGFHASQCGFCTPGMCISLYSALSNAHYSKSSQSSPDYLSASAAEKSIVGNLCRCTGYRPIADACKSFAADVDIEDLGFNSFWRKGESKEEIKKLPPYNPDRDLLTFPDFLKERIMRQHNVLDEKKYHWITPLSLAELHEILARTNPSGDKGSMKLVVGNTGIGYYKEEKHYDRYIDMSHIPEMLMIKKDDRGIEIGAAVTISKVIDALMEENSFGSYVFKKIGIHLEKVANNFIRNSGSIGGNLVMAQSKSFPSDIATLLLAADASVHMINAGRHVRLRMGEFLVLPPILDTKTVLLKVHIPRWIASSTTGLLFETYRAAPRPIGNTLPYMNAVFLAVVSHYSSSRGIIVDKCRLAFGSYGGYHSIRAREVEDFLTGKLLSYDVLYEAVRLLKGIIVPTIETSYIDYKKSLAVGFLFDFLSPLIESGSWGSERKHIDGHVYPTISYPMLSSAQQVFESKEFHPVGEAVIKYGAELQASGEAVYIDDIPSLPNCLHGAFIYSTMPLARIKKVGFREKEAPIGVLAVITSKDIPQAGQNIGYVSTFGSGLLFADEVTINAGQIIALVVADTQKHADMAANLAEVEYDSKNLEPVLSMEDAVERSSFFDVPPEYKPEPFGDILKGMAEADHKIRSVELRLGSQYFFYMETQTSLALPDEDKCIVVYSATQSPEDTQSVIATCLGIPEHNVRVITRRLGGGFGGKAIKSMLVATACAVAAQKLQRPVRMYLNRKTDMIMAGGRHPMKVTYSVGFRYDGKLTALELVILIDAGIDVDISPIIPMNLIDSLKIYDWGALSFDVKVCKTNLPSRTSMRAPGEVQGSYIAEFIIESVACSLNMDVDVVRIINLHTYGSLKNFYKQAAGKPDEYNLPLLWEKLEISSNFKQRAEMVKEFNLSNVWRKRGISRVPIILEVKNRATPGIVSILSDGSVVVEVPGIEMGQGLLTKVQQMVAYGLSLTKTDKSEKLLERIRLIQTDTLSLVQSSYTSSSTTSENCCEAVRICCGILVERLKPTLDQLLENARSVTWDTLIQQAHAQSVDLSARTFYKPESSTAYYLNYGVGASEVEIDLVTGRTEILRTDIIYDCGKSLNPAVDLGQIEGAFVQGLGFYMYEEYTTDKNGLVIQEGTWDYKIPTIDTIPKQFNVQILNSGHHKNRILSSKASGEPPLLVSASVHCATRSAIKEARKQYLSWNGESRDIRSDDPGFELPVPAIMPVVKQLCGLESIEKYLESKTSSP